MTQALCTHCSAGPTGEGGHRALSFYVDGPYPGHRIYKCNGCDERWIRHYGSPTSPFAWTCYSKQFPMRKPMADSVRPTHLATQLPT